MPGRSGGVLAAAAGAASGGKAVDHCPVRRRRRTGGAGDRAFYFLKTEIHHRGHREHRGITYKKQVLGCAQDDYLRELLVLEHYQESVDTGVGSQELESADDGDMFCAAPTGARSAVAAFPRADALG